MARSRSTRRRASSTSSTADDPRPPSRLGLLSCGLRYHRSTGRARCVPPPYPRTHDHHLTATLRRRLTSPRRHGSDVEADEQAPSRSTASPRPWGPRPGPSRRRREPEPSRFRPAARRARRSRARCARRGRVRRSRPAEWHDADRRPYAGAFRRVAERNPRGHPSGERSPGGRRPPELRRRRLDRPRTALARPSRR